MRRKPAGEDKKDRKRSEPKDPFDGKNLIEWEWRLNNHMEVTFGSRGRDLMKWIREKAQGEDSITAEAGKMKFDNWEDMDKELWTQVMRSEGEEVTSIIQSATQSGIVGAEAWRALKSRYDPETAITLEAWRGELFKDRRCSKIEDVVSRLTQWENKMSRLNNALRASGKSDISEEDQTMVLKDLIPVELEEELRKMIKIKAVKDSYRECRNYVMQEARTLEERQLRKKDQREAGGQDGLCNGMHDNREHKDGKGPGEQTTPTAWQDWGQMNWLGGKKGGGKGGKKGDWASKGGKVGGG